MYAPSTRIASDFSLAEQRQPPLISQRSVAFSTPNCHSRRHGEERRGAQSARARGDGHRLPARPGHGRRDPRADGPAPDGSGGPSHAPDPGPEGPAEARVRRSALRLPSHAGARGRPPVGLPPPARHVLRGVCTRRDGGPRRDERHRPHQSPAAASQATDRRRRARGEMSMDAFSWLVALTLRCTVVLSVALGLGLFLRRSSAVARHRLLTLTAVSLLALPLLAWVLPSLELPLAIPGLEPSSPAHVADLSTPAETMAVLGEQGPLKPGPEGAH